MTKAETREKSFFRVEYRNGIDDDGNNYVQPTVWIGNQGFDLSKQYEEEGQTAKEHAKWFISMFENALQSYAEYYHREQLLIEMMQEDEKAGIYKLKE